SLETGLRTLRLAVDTHAITSHFAIPLLIETPGGLVVEMTDGTDDYNATTYRVSFFYDLAKAAVGRMAFALAHELAPHRATAVSLTPGWLRSEAMLEAYGVTEGNWQDATARSPHFAISESPAFIGRAVVALAADPDVSRWNGDSLSSGQLAKVYGFTDLDGSRPDCWRYITEVQDAGKPADGTGYRRGTLRARRAPVEQQAAERAPGGCLEPQPLRPTTSPCAESIRSPRVAAHPAWTFSRLSARDTRRSTAASWRETLPSSLLRASPAACDS